MRQVWITKFGPPEVLTVRQAPDPEPKPGEVRIRVEASGVNFADIADRVGLYPDLPPVPVVPGYEVSGRIDAAGTGVDSSWIGRDVLAMTRFGGYADVVCVPVNQVFARPPGMSALEAAAIPVNYFTAWQLVVVMGALKRGETVLVTPRTTKAVLDSALIENIRNTALMHFLSHEHRKDRAQRGDLLRRTRH